MKSFIWIRKGATIALFLFLTGCSPAARSWNLQKTTTSQACYNSGRLLLTPESDYGGIELQIDRGSFGQRMYLNTRSLPFSINKEGKSVVKVSNATETVTIQATSLEGRQRVLIPDDTASWIIRNLLEGQTLTVVIGRYKTEISPHDFRYKYRELNCI